MQCQCRCMVMRWQHWCKVTLLSLKGRTPGAAGPYADQSIVAQPSIWCRTWPLLSSVISNCTASSIITYERISTV